MWSLIFRLAMMGGAMLVMWNVVVTFARALRHPAKTIALPPETRDEAAARDMVERALSRVTAIEIAIASLKDEDLWTATEAMADAVSRLTRAVLGDPPRYRRARRHLGQVLFGAEHVSKKFATIYGGTPDPDAKARFISLLADLERAYDRAAKAYARSGMDDLEIETAVIRELIDRAKKR